MKNPTEGSSFCVGRGGDVVMWHVPFRKSLMRGFFGSWQ